MKKRQESTTHWRKWAIQSSIVRNSMRLSKLAHWGRTDEFPKAKTKLWSHLADSPFHTHAEGTMRTTCTLKRNTISKEQAMKPRNREFNTIYDYAQFTETFGEQRSWSNRKRLVLAEDDTRQKWCVYRLDRESDHSWESFNALVRVVFTRRNRCRRLSATERHRGFPERLIFCLHLAFRFNQRNADCRWSWKYNNHAMLDHIERRSWRQRTNHLDGNWHDLQIKERSSKNGYSKSKSRHLWDEHWRSSH